MNGDQTDKTNASKGLFSTAVRRSWPVVTSLVLMLVLAGCSSMPERGNAPQEPAQSSEQGADAGEASNDALLVMNESSDEAPVFEGTERFEGSGDFLNEQGIGERAPPPSEDGEITLNFEGQGVQEVVHAILHELLQVNYIISPGVSGQVTFSTAKPVGRDQVMPILEMLLRWNGATLIWREGKYHVVPIGEAVRGNLVPRFDSAAEAQGYEVMAVPLEYISPAKMAEILIPYAREDGIFNADNARGILFIAGTRYELNNYLQIVETFDVDWLAGMSVGMFALERIEVGELLPELEAVFGQGGETPLAGMFRFIPIDRLNAVMVITPNEHYLDEAERWIARLDRSSPEAGARLYVYRVKNLEADVLAGYLSGLFGSSSGSTTRASSRRDAGEVAPGMEQAEVSSVNEFNASQRSSSGGSGGTGGSGMLLGDTEDVRVTSVKETNSLLIQASPGQYDAILSAIKRLDEEPLQVLVEAQVLIVDLNDQLRYGVSWFLANRGSELSEGGSAPVDLPESFAPTRDGNTLVFGAGTNVLGTLTRRDLSRSYVSATIDALESVSNVRTISSPSLMVRNNSSATINVGSQVPVQSTSFVTGGNAGSTIGNVSFISTGVTLEVTPRVNPGGLVYLDIRQEVSSPGDPGVGNNPSINTRTLSTEIAVQSGQTVLMGGLIQDDESESQAGVPGLQRIPGLGALFRSTTNRATRSETLVLITPTVIESMERLKAVSDEISERFRGLEPLRVRVETLEE